MSIFISATSPTSDYKESILEKAITGVAMKLAQHRSKSKLPAGPSLDVNFLLTGKYEEPSFSGMRMGNYSIDQETLYFERSVPGEMIHSNNAEKFVEAVLQDVITNAADFFSEMNVNFDLVSWKRTLKEL